MAPNFPHGILAPVPAVPLRCLLALCLVAAAGCGSERPRPLQAGKGLDVDHPGAGLPGSVHRYVLSLQAGETARIAVDQRGIDLRLRVEAPAGRSLFQRDAPTTSFGPETLTLIAPVDGSYVLSLEPVLTKALPGAYRIHVRGLGPTTADDARAVAAEEVFSRAGVLHWGESARERREALAGYREALAGFEAVGAERQAGWALLNLAECQADLGDPYSALDPARRAVERLRAVGDAAGEAEALVAVAYLRAGLGELRAALGLNRRALRIHRRLGNTIGAANALHNIADFYQEIGDLETARATYDEALAVMRDGGDRWGEAYTLTDIGQLETRRGRPEEALPVLRRALDLRRQVGDRAGEARTLAKVGEALGAVGRDAEALGILDRALDQARGLGRSDLESRVLLRLGGVHLEQGRLEAASAAYRGAWETSRTQGNALEEIEAASGLGRVERGRGALEASLAWSEAALARIEDMRFDVASDAFRASVLAARRDHYERAIAVRMELEARAPGQGHGEAAFHLSERARARSLLDSLVRLGAAPQPVAPELERRLGRLRQRLNALAMAEVEAEDGAQDGIEARAPDSTRELDAILASYREARAEVAAAREAGEARAATPLTLRQVQDRVVDPGTLLLAVSLGEELSVLWTISRDGTTSHALPPRARLEGLALQAHRALTAPRRAVRFELAAERRLRLEAARREASTALESLSRHLLAPLGERLAGERLALVLDGALGLVPFAALPVPEGVGGALPGSRLGDRFELVRLPSASALAAQRARRASAPRSSESQSGGAALVLADPVYAAADPRLPSPWSPGAGAEGEREEDLVLALPRLPASGREARALLALLGPGSARAALGTAARRDVLLGSDAAGARLIHLAAHALVRERRPELSSLALSRFDAEGRPLDGFLRLHELEELSLVAELVVLSACRTAAGEPVRGEGLIGLGRGFLRAGAARVVGSLWEVDDEATAALMEAFYRHLLVHGRTPASALSRARREMAADPRWAAPVDWAGFVLIGDWRPVVGPWPGNWTGLRGALESP